MIYFSAILLCFIGIANSAKLPDKFPRCSRNDPNFENCLTNAIQSSVPSLVKGVPNLGVIPIDPLRISRLDIAQGEGPVSLDLKFKDLDIKNFGFAKINKATADVDKYIIKIDSFLTKPMILDGDYEINGKVLVLPITGKGKAHIELENVDGHLTLQGKEIVRDGKKYMDLSDLQVKFSTTRLRVNLENLFNNDKALGDQMNSFLNENWKEILNELKPAIESALGAAFKEIARRLFTKVPYDDIFLP